MSLIVIQIAVPPHDTVVVEVDQASTLVTEATPTLSTDDDPVVPTGE